jgi:hypothetical protein
VPGWRPIDRVGVELFGEGPLTAESERSRAAQRGAAADRDDGRDHRHRLAERCTGAFDRGPEGRSQVTHAGPESRAGHGLAAAGGSRAPAHEAGQREKRRGASSDPAAPLAEQWLDTELTSLAPAGRAAPRVAVEAKPIALRFHPLGQAADGRAHQPAAMP